MKKNKSTKSELTINRQEVMDGGATRCVGVAGDKPGEFPARFDLVLNNPIGLRRLAQTYGEGAIKYGPDNWKKGFPESNLINHAMAHLTKHIEGDRTEDHIAHAVWNLYTLMHFQVTRPDLMDLSGPSSESA